MKLRHRVRVHVCRPDGGKEAVLEAAQGTLRSRLLRRLVGDQYAVLVLTLSPSSSERWYHYPPSAWLCEQFPDQGSVFAAEGTEAHSLCEYLLLSWLGRPDLTDPRAGMQYYCEEMKFHPGDGSGASLRTLTNSYTGTALL